MLWMPTAITGILPLRRRSCCCKSPPSAWRRCKCSSVCLKGEQRRVGEEDKLDNARKNVGRFTQWNFVRSSSTRMRICDPSAAWGWSGRGGSRFLDRLPVGRKLAAAVLLRPPSYLVYVPLYCIECPLLFGILLSSDFPAINAILCQVDMFMFFDVQTTNSTLFVGNKWHNIQ